MRSRSPINLVVVLLIAGILAIAGSVPECATTSERPSMSSYLAGLSSRDSVTILITDSGLGGLSVAAEIERRLQDCHWFSNVRLVFANALVSNDRPYNSMATTEEKVATFSAALEGFQDKFSPDIILIACNTLSVIYDQTDFSTHSTVPVYGIVDFGVNMIAERLDRTSGSAILLGTPTTTESGAHLSGLMERGVDSARIVVQACPMLESEIQSDPQSDVVAMMIEMFAMEANEGSSPSGDDSLVVALCCTHYGYAADVFDSVFSEVAGRPVSIVDPNTAMSSALFDHADCSKHSSSVTTVEVVSRAELTQDDVTAISRMIERQSGVTADALRRYTLDSSLFAL